MIYKGFGFDNLFKQPFITKGYGKKEGSVKSRGDSS